MAFVWVQQWYALPVVFEGPMGDLPPQSRGQALDSAATGFLREGHQGHPASSSSPYKAPDNNTPFYSQLSSIPQTQLRPDYRSPAHPSAPQEHGATPLNLSSMAGALPDYGSVDDASLHPHGSQSIPRSLSGPSTSTVVYQLGQNLQMPAHASGNLPNSSYGTGYAVGPYQQQAFGHPPFAANQSRMYPQPAQHMYYSAPYGQYSYNSGFHSMGMGMPQSGPVGSNERRGSMAGASVGLTSPQNMDFQHHDGTFAGARMGPGVLQGDQAVIGSTFGAPYARVPGKKRKPFLRCAGSILGSSADNGSTGMPHSGPVSSIPRGPPRKPKQSGHALWVGNLPPGTTVVALKDHFSREATKDIESLFLISKSNCAFVNYRSEASCTAAMHRFHDSRFNGVRLVCRLRRSSAPASGVPTGPSAMVGSQQISTSPPKTPKLDVEAVDHIQEGGAASPSQKGGDEAPATSSSSSNKYFIVKSLTLQDLELSVRNGIWATQSHNEDVLNKAFRVSTAPFPAFVQFLTRADDRECVPHFLSEQVR